MAFAGVVHWGIPTPFPVGDVKAWYLPGRVPALIDPGPRTDDAWEALERHVRKHPVKFVLFTHHHVDHSGLAARLQREFGVEVAAHRLEADVLAHWGERAAERERDYEHGLVRAGVPPGLLEKMRYGGRRFDTFAENVTADHRLEEGSRLSLGDDDFEVLHVPGHTSGSIVLRRTDRTISLSGDTLLAKITPNALSVRASERNALPDYLRTLARLRGEQLGEILPGHGPRFSNPHEVIDAGLRHAQLRQQRIRSFLATGPTTAFDMAQRLFLRLPDSQQFLAVSETLGHLECMRGAGEVRIEQQGPIDQYVSTQV
ncbi:MAG TPA: MBL fold metallo-hydrolase [Candidatus Thermoplasmatota archaeon]